MTGGTTAITAIGHEMMMQQDAGKRVARRILSTSHKEMRLVVAVEEFGKLYRDFDIVGPSYAFETIRDQLGIGGSLDLAAQLLAQVSGNNRTPGVQMARQIARDLATITDSHANADASTKLKRTVLRALSADAQFNSLMANWKNLGTTEQIAALQTVANSLAAKLNVKPVQIEMVTAEPTEKPYLYAQLIVDPVGNAGRLALNTSPQSRVTQDGHFATELVLRRAFDDAQVQNAARIFAGSDQTPEEMAFAISLLAERDAGFALEKERLPSPANRQAAAFASPALRPALSLGFKNAVNNVWRDLTGEGAEKTTRFETAPKIRR